MRALSPSHLEACCPCPGEGAHLGIEGVVINIATHFDSSHLQRQENKPKPESNPSLTVVQ